MDEKLDLLYLDDHLAVVYKPAGLLVHRTDIARGQATQYALQMVRDQLGRYVYPIHRIDRPTAGLLLFGLDEESTRRLKFAFDEKRIDKRYLAIVRGRPPEAGLIEKPLKKVHPKRPDAEPQPAETEFRRLATVELPIQTGRYPVSWYSLMEARPRTGRTHQIRRHFAHLRSPIIGDTAYGDNTQNKFFRAHFEVHRLLLCAAQLRFAHPISDVPLRVTTRPDPEWVTVAEKLGWDFETLFDQFERDPTPSDGKFSPDGGNLSSF